MLDHQGLPANDLEQSRALRGCLARPKEVFAVTRLLMVSLAYTLITPNLATDSGRPRTYKGQTGQTLASALLHST